MIELVLLALVGAAMVAGAAYDATTLTIPNWISLVLIALFPILALTAGLSFGETGLHAGVGLGALVVGMLLFAGGIIGGGDAKLFAAIALYMGTGSVAPYVFAVAVAGGVVAFVMLAAQRLSRSILIERLGWLKRLVNVGKGVPYGIAIAAGGVFVFPATHLFALATATL